MEKWFRKMQTLGWAQDAALQIALENASVSDIQSYSNGTTDYCSSITWSGQDESQNMYQSGKLKIVISSK